MVDSIQLTDYGSAISRDKVGKCDRRCCFDVQYQNDTSLIYDFIPKYKNRLKIPKYTQKPKLDCDLSINNC
jgi:hypothetical protein